MSNAVPGGWSKVKLGRIGTFSTSSVDKKAKDEEPSASLLNYMDIYRNSVLSSSYPFKKTTAPSKQVTSSSVQNGDVFFTPSSETPDDIGHSAVFLGSSERLVHSYHTIRFRPKTNDHLDDNYKAYAFKGTETYEYFRKRATGSTRFSVSLPIFNELEVLTPPLPEQKKIAFILTSVDEVIEKTESQISKLQDLKKATMNELLTKGIGHAEYKESPIGRIPKKWGFEELNKLASIKHGYAFSGECLSNTPSEYTLLTLGNFHKDGHLYFGDNTKYVTGEIPSEYILSNGDVLVVMTDLTKEMTILGNSIILDSSRIVLHNQRIGKLELLSKENERIRYEYLNAVLNSFYVKNHVKNTATATTVRNTSPTKILEPVIPLPPIEEQTHIVNALESVHAKLVSAENKRISLTKLKKALTQDLLTGEVRVKV